MEKYLILNGPNINMTGIREKGVYGSKTYEDLCLAIQQEADKLGVKVTFVQSNSEGKLIDALQDAWRQNYAGVIFNPGGYTHTSIALHDAVASIPQMVVEVHMSNIHAREEYRHVSMTASAARGQIVGFGFDGYIMALDQLVKENEGKQQKSAD